VAGEGRYLGNLAAFRSPLGDRARIGRWHSAMTPPMVVVAECLKTLRKNISQFIVNAGYFSQAWRLSTE